MSRFIEWHKHTRRPERPTRFHFWPISFGWVRNSCHAFITWHGWPIDGSGIYPDATFKDCGWTLHIGAFKVKFGKLNKQPQD
jgi:hypothetical protein